MTRRVRLSVAMTHPIQYYAPWFRHITANLADVELTVHYCITPTPEQQGVGFDESFTWDASLLDGYESIILRKPSHRTEIHSSSFFGVTVPEIAASIRRAKPDIVLVPGWYSMSLVTAALSARVGGLPVLYRGDSQVKRDEGPNIVRTLRTKALLGMFTHFLAVGRRNHEYLRSYAVPESRIFFSPHCVDNEFFAAAAAATDRDAERRALNIPSEAFVVLFAGKLEAKKRPWEVIEAAGTLSPSPTVLIAGSGEEEAKCRVAAARSAANVLFLGFRNQGALARLYAVADCLALPSDSGETWGLVVNEALAAGLPCVVSDRVGCAPDLIESGRTGYISPFADVAELSRALGRIRDSISNGHAFDAACREKAAGYSFETATAGLRQAVMAAVAPLLNVSAARKGMS